MWTLWLYETKSHHLHTLWCLHETTGSHHPHRHCGGCMKQNYIIYTHCGGCIKRQDHITHTDTSCGGCMKRQDHITHTDTVVVA